MAWLNIIAAIVFQMYRIITIGKRKNEFFCEQFEKTLESDGDGKIYGITIVTDQTAVQEATEQTQIVQHEPISCEETDFKDSQETEQ